MVTTILVITIARDAKQTALSVMITLEFALFVLMARWICLIITPVAVNLENTQRHFLQATILIQKTPNLTQLRAYGVINPTEL